MKFVSSVVNSAPGCINHVSLVVKRACVKIHALSTSVLYSSLGPKNNTPKCNGY